MIDFLNLRCNGLQEPDCIDKAPTFTWNYRNSYDRDVFQKYVTLTLFDAEGNALFSKKTMGRAMQYAYKGKLTPLSDYFWQITAKLSNGQTLESSRQHFATGLMGGKLEETGAKWIAGSKKYEHSAVSFRKKIAIRKPVRKASAYLFATAWQDVSVNGKLLKEDCYFLPCNSPYNEKCVYEKYDLTDALQVGENVLNILTGAGYNSNYSQWGWRVFCGKMLIGFVDICYADGTFQRIVTDGTWELYSSNIPYCDIYHGQHMDARLTEEKLEDVRTVSSPVKKAVFVANEMPPVKVLREIKPLSFKKVGNACLCDMGENFCGVAKISLRAPKGTKITLQFSELVYSNGDQRTTSNYKAKAQDWYICSGEGVETFLPRFASHGYRYVKITGLTSKVQDFRISGIFLSADVSSASYFRCSDAVVNAVHENTVRSLRSNLVTIPTDCPSRGERTPCAMDSQCVEVSDIYNFNMLSYYRKWVEDLALFTDTISDHGNPDWDGDQIMLADRLLSFCNDNDTYKRYYKKMAACLRSFARQSSDYLWYDGFGDWCHPNENTWETFHSSVPVVNTCLFYAVSRNMAKFAALMGKTEDAKEFCSLAENIQKAFLKTHLKPDGTVNDGTHVEQALTLYVQILPEDKVQAVVDQLAHKLRTEMTDLGIFGMMAVARVLPKYGHSDLLLDILHDPQYPGFLYCIANGATSLWEVWNFDGRMASHNHAMFGGIGEAFYAGFAGIKPLENGFTRFEVDPKIPEKLNFVECAVETVSGVIEMQYRKNAAGVELKLSVPANTQAEVYLPEIPGAVLHDGEVIVEMGEKKNGRIHLSLGSGNYDLRLVEGTLLFENTFENRYIVVD